LLKAKIQQLYTDAQKGDRFNLMPSIVEAVEAYATSGEVIGTIRKARGLNYDPFNMIDCRSRCTEGDDMQQETESRSSSR
jgi:hypothetical protein